VQVNILHVFEQDRSSGAFSNRLRSFLAIQLADQQTQTHQGRDSKRFHVNLSSF
jgi:hypothetical protein